jgi:hypothetical protein
LATLRIDAKLFDDVDQLRWLGPSESFSEFTEKIGEPKLLDRATALAAKIV